MNQDMLMIQRAPPSKRSEAKKPRILLFDTENSPTLYYAWDIYDSQALKIIKHWHFLSFAWKWLGDKRVKVLALPDFPGYEKHLDCDKALTKQLWKLFDEADIIIAHNAPFDIKHANTRFLLHGLPPPSPYKVFDTLAAYRSKFGFISNKLNDLSRQTSEHRGEIEEKKRTGGADLWFDCMRGDKKAWKRMKAYNKHDVVLLENRYKDVRGWMPSHPNLSAYAVPSKKPSCGKCGSPRTQWRGWYRSNTMQYRVFRCYDCRGTGKLTSGERVSTSTNV